MTASCKDCGAAVVWALTKSGTKVAMEFPSEKRYVRVDTDDSDPIVSLRDTYIQHTCKPL
jgi:hypothetical protein